MKSKFKKIVIDKFELSIPKKYKIKKHSPYWMNKLFFLIYKRKIKREFPGLPSYSPDYDCLKGLRLYEVKMGTHSFMFSTEIGKRKPEDLAGFIESQTRCLPTLKDITINGCRGKMHGDYSEQMTWIDWWIKRDDCMISLNLQGLGMPSRLIKDDISDILNSLEYIGE
ncbi:MAG: hypothetical protein ACYSSO_14640 [Planctomycetota bacterium]|jgi:hypothetical protein